MNTLTIGADPEKFVQDGAGVIRSAIGMLGGSKEKPRPVKCGAVQEDNVLAEFNIDPANTVEEWLGNLSTVTSEMDSILSANGLTSLTQTSHMFEQDYLMDLPIQALEFGCDPDYNCWTQLENARPNPYTELRTAGGHVHVGYDNPTQERSYEIACILDYLLGVSSVLLDDDTRRRDLYGKSGACRLKAYGVEYRVLSNFWLGNEELQSWIFNVTSLVSNLDIGYMMENFASPDKVQNTINTSDKKAAEEIVSTMIDNIEGFYMPKGA